MCNVGIRVVYAEAAALGFGLAQLYAEVGALGFSLAGPSRLLNLPSRLL